MNIPFHTRHAPGVEAAPCHPISRMAPQPSYATARAQIEQELGPRPSITSVGGWTGYRTNSDADEGAAFASHFAKLEAMRRWDRAVSDRCKALGAVHTLGDS